MPNEEDNLFEHLSLGRVFSRTMDLFVDRFDVYMALAAVVSIPSAVMLALVGAFARLEELELSKIKAGEDPDAAAMSLIAFVGHHAHVIAIVYVIQVIFFTLIMLVGEGGVIRATADTYAAQPQGWFVCLKVGVQQFCSLLGTAVLVGIPTYVGLTIAILASKVPVLGFLLIMLYAVGLCYLVASTCLAYPVVVVENKGPMQALRRSLELTEGRRFYTFCPICVFYIVRFIVGFLLHNIFNSSDNPLRYMTPTGIIVSFVPDLLYMPLNTILKMVLYASIRVDKEGLTKTILQRELVEPVSFTDPSASGTQDYRQVSLMEDNSKDSVATGLVSEFA